MKKKTVTIIPRMNMVKKVKSIHFQRNGVRGHAFYTAVVTLKGEEGDFIVTFDSKRDNEATIDIQSVRCVSVFNPAHKWHGDCVGDDIQNYINSKLEKGQIIYDLLTK